MNPLPPPQWLGTLDYDWALRLQRLRRDAVVRGAAPEALWLLEHRPVVTTGRRAVHDIDPACPIPVVRTERGGLATWHGPGQLVGYLILDVAGRGGSVKGTVAGVEQGVIRWLADRGIEAGRRPGFPGVWVGEEKVCAVGMHFRRGVSMHGFALNLCPDLGGYRWIVPCGIRDGGVTSVARVAGLSPAPAEAFAGVGELVRRALVDTWGGGG